jgi:hypothetical protein
MLQLVEEIPFYSGGANGGQPPMMGPLNLLSILYFEEQTS